MTTAQQPAGIFDNAKAHRREVYMDGKLVAWCSKEVLHCRFFQDGFQAHAERCPVVVELPPLFRGITPECQANNNAVELCRTAIEAAGGKVAR